MFIPILQPKEHTERGGQFAQGHAARVHSPHRWPKRLEPQALGLLPHAPSTWPGAWPLAGLSTGTLLCNFLVG